VSPPVSRESEDLMLDPSVFLSPPGFRALSRLLDSPEDPGSLFVPATFQNAVAERRFDPVLRRYFGLPPRAMRVEERDVDEGMLGLPPIPSPEEIASALSEFEIRSYAPATRDLQVARDTLTIEVGQLLTDAYPWPVGSILFEEWLFLQSHSWIASRRKWAFGRFVWAGGVAVEVGRRGYEAVRSRAEDELPPLLTRQGSKGVARWIARSGSTAAAAALLAMGGLWEAAITKAVGKAVDVGAKRIFLLIDP
jgi:hypothetical protein